MFLTHPSLHQPGGGLHALVLVNNAARNLGAHRPFPVVVFVFFKIHTRRGSAWFWGTSMLCSIATAPVHIPTNRVLRFPSLHLLTNACSFCFVLFFWVIPAWDSLDGQWIGSGGYTTSCVQPSGVPALFSNIRCNAWGSKGCRWLPLVHLDPQPGPPLGAWSLTFMHMRSLCRKKKKRKKKVTECNINSAETPMGHLLHPFGPEVFWELRTRSKDCNKRCSQEKFLWTRKSQSCWELGARNCGWRAHIYIYIYIS